ncbi:hypothetical protein ACQY0O_005861 [Thecaphora frezii]
MFVMGQVHTIMEFWLRRRLRECRNTAYMATVRSRGKSADWWTEYFEEFSNPPTEKAIKDAKKQAFYVKLASPFVRMVVLKIFLLPVDFVPFFGMALGAALRSLSFGRTLHLPFFEAKRMTPAQVELWVTERQGQYRAFGFVAALMERIPLVGLVFSVSNRIGAAMWAHDLEKRQQLMRAAGPDAKIAYKEKLTMRSIAEEANVAAPTRTEQFTGEGLAVLRSHPTGVDERTAVFTHMSFTFPLKLISPRASSRIASRKVFEAASDRRAGLGAGDDAGQDAVEDEGISTSPKAVAALYIVGYGGGLVSGDTVDLDVDVGHHCAMLLLTQGSTKVFKMRQKRPSAAATGVAATTAAGPATRQPARSSADSEVAPKLVTRQTFRFLVRPRSTLILLPDPVTCFASARYDQVQRFDVRNRKTSSLVLLDWITPGRTAVRQKGGEGASRFATGPRRPEVWSFESYRSRNEVRIEGKVVTRDVLLLEQDLELDVRLAKESDSTPGDVLEAVDTELARRNSPYGCYATLILTGPDARRTINRLADEFERIQQRVVTASVPPLIWSLSFLETEQLGSGQKRSHGGAAAAADRHEDPGCVIVRVGGKDSEAVREWLRLRLVDLKDTVGADLYRQALGG